MSKFGEARQQDFESFRSYLYLLARAHLGANRQSSAEASDLVQQTLMDAHQKRDQFLGDSDAQRAAWLKRILTNNIADAMRYRQRAKRDVSRERSLEATIDGSFRQAEHCLAAIQSSPSQHVAKKEQLLMLSDALTRLPEAQREAVILRHLKGLSLAAVSERMLRSETAVAGLIYRGLNRLHELLDEQETT